MGGYGLVSPRAAQCVCRFSEPFAAISSDFRVRSSFEQVPAVARTILCDKFALCSSRIAAHNESVDGDTTKMEVTLSDGLRVETVLMRHGKRTTVCVSSQVGCAMGCTFCATGTMGILGDLSSGEIIQQLLHARHVELRRVAEQTDGGASSAKKLVRQSLVRNVVFMGMGEPLNNYRAVVRAVKLFIDPALFGLSPKSVTVSTVGIVPRMKSFVSDLPGVSLALSLHSPTQVKRETIMPAARAYPLHRVFAALEAHMAAARPYTPTSKTAMIEYIMLRDVNDTLEDATALAELLRPHADLLVLNLIPYNPTDATPEYRRATQVTTSDFAGVLRASGVLTCIRRTMGDDIAGACGQLVRQQEHDAPASVSKGSESKRHAQASACSDIEDLGDALRAEIRPSARRGRTPESQSSIRERSPPDPNKRRVAASQAPAPDSSVATGATHAASGDFVGARTVSMWPMLTGSILIAVLCSCYIVAFAALWRGAAHAVLL